MDSERTTTTNWAFRREIGNALGYTPHPDYDWAHIDGQYLAWDIDLNLAMTLLDSVDYEHTPRVVRMLGSTGHYWKCAILSNSHGNDFEVTEESAALAICKAFLDYRAAHPTPTPASEEA